MACSPRSAAAMKIARCMAWLARCSPAAIAAHYGGLLDALIVDAGDAGAAAGLSKPVFSTDTLMRSLEDRVRLARFVLDTVARLRAD